MNTEQVLDEFRGAGALREGHFILASGRHSAMFLQKNLVFQFPERTARLCKALAEKIEAAVGKPDVIVAPAVGATMMSGLPTAASIFSAKALHSRAVRSGNWNTRFFCRNIALCRPDARMKCPSRKAPAPRNSSSTCSVFIAPISNLTGISESAP